MSNLFEHYIFSENFEVKYAKGKPSVSGREFHEHHEIIFYMGGDSQLISKDIQIHLEPGSVIFVPKEHFHQFNMSDYEGYLRCVFIFHETPETKELINETMKEIAVFPTPTSTMLSVFENLMAACTTPLSTEEKALFLKASLVNLLMDRKLFTQKPIKKYVTVSQYTERALTYIDKHYSDDLKLEDIAKILNISISSLSHHFRKDLNISVYRYISQKRLSMARQFVNNGASLSAAAALCGFKDYSTFFRLYKSHFAERPSETKK